MFDPEVTLSPRLANQFGLKKSVFYPKAENDEQELKYDIAGGYGMYEKIRAEIAEKPNRFVDEENWTSNQYALVTLNLDTPDQELARNGYSLRVRFALTKQHGAYVISNIDMCIKTLMPSEKTTILHKQTRGEWEAELKSLSPSMTEMIRQNAGKKPALPDFFKDGHIKDSDLFVESTGCTLRHVFPSYEIIRKGGNIIVPTFQHTEDVINVFLTPRGDIVTGQDSEAEAEFLGLHCNPSKKMNGEKFEKYMRKSMELLDSIIVGASPAQITRNLISKGTRARIGLDSLYGPKELIAPKDAFTRQASIEQASHFALMQRVRPEDVNLNVFWHQIEKMRAKVHKEMFASEKLSFRNDLR